MLRFGLHRIGQMHCWLDEQEITLTSGTELPIPMPFWSGLDRGLLYFSLLALEDGGRIDGGYFGTETAPERETRLGIVITHFNRRDYVLPAIRRIKDELLDDPSYAKNIELIIIDNSRNIATEEAAGATLIPNRNLGGSGGFMRGLLHLEDAKTFTHCLFMDDDASCEIESLRRAFALLSYAKTPKFAVSGALLREIEPHRLFEKGAVYDGFCRPLNCGRDMRSVHDLLLAERNEQHGNYGAWWFFGFALKDVTSYAFPYFVRGDDITFSLMNKFNILTANGIACWGEDFQLKSGPLPRYLDMRQTLLLRMVMGTKSARSDAQMAYRFFLDQSYSYCYASAAAISLAVEHVAQGPQFWRDNIDMSQVRAEIAAIPSEEKMRPVDRAELKVSYYNHRRKTLEKVFRKITMNGMLIPRRFLKKRVLLQPKDFVGRVNEIYRYENVLYEYEPTQTGFVATHDADRFKKDYPVFLKRLFRFYRNYKVVQTAYRHAVPEMTSWQFWVHTFDAGTKKGPTLSIETAKASKDTFAL